MSLHTGAWLCEWVSTMSTISLLNMSAVRMLGITTVGQHTAVHESANTRCFEWAITTRSSIALLYVCAATTPVNTAPGQRAAFQKWGCNPEVLESH